MWTYLIDAYDDFDDDQKRERFNPLNAFTVGADAENSCEIGLRSGEMMLGMMTANLFALQKEINFYHHEEIIENIISYGTRSSVQKIKTRREKARNAYNCRK